MQMVCQRVAAHHSSQGQQHLDLVLVDTFQQPIGDPSEQKPESDTTARLSQQGFHRKAGCWPFAFDRYAQHKGKQHDRYAIVE